MATSVARRRPSLPMSWMYAHGIGRIPAEPHGAADTGPGPVEGPASGTSGWFGRNGARCDRTPMGPTPRPPPPWREQHRELALRSGIRLQRHGVVTGHGTQPPFEIVDELEITRGLIERRERMDLREPRPRDRLHLRGGVQLHRARPERDHRPIERDVLVGQAPQVPEHRGLAAVLVEHRMREKRLDSP